MPKRDIRSLRRLASEGTVRGKIFDEFGEERIKEAKNRLCSKCFYGFCFLMPLTTKGEDCPYFKLKEVKK